MTTSHDAILRLQRDMYARFADLEARVLSLLDTQVRTSAYLVELATLFKALSENQERIARLTLPCTPSSPLPTTPAPYPPPGEFDADFEGSRP